MDEQMIEPCPFCGGPGHLDRFEDPPRGRGWHVVCHGTKYCPAYCSTPYSDLLNKVEVGGKVGLSFGFRARAAAILNDHRELFELQLVEISVVPHPMQTLATAQPLEPKY